VDVGVDARAVVESEVRELVRRRGIDPQAEPSRVRSLVEAVVADYGERSLTGGLPAIDDALSVVQNLMDAVTGFGPLQRYFDDPTVEEIWINEPGRVFVARSGRSELTTTILTPGGLEDLVERMLSTSGRRVDLSQPFVDASLPDGSRLHVAIPDVTRRHWAVNVRRFVMHRARLDELVVAGSMTSHAARFLEAAVVSGLNVVVAGGTQVGKTTLLNALVNAIPSGERLITCEEVFELQPTLADVVALQPSEQTTIYRGFRTFLGNYVAHCHNLAHEDHNMMFGWSITK